MLPAWPALKFLVYMEREYGLLIGLASVPPAWFGWGVVLCVEMLLAKWIVIGRYRAGNPQNTAADRHFLMRGT